MMYVARRILAVLGLAMAASVSAQVQWDLPTAYPATNFHTENINQFASEIEKATAGKLRIKVHPASSLFKLNEIKRAVQSGQVPIGEILLSAQGNEAAILRLDALPFFATSYADAAKLWKLSKGPIEAYFAKQGMKVLYSVPWPPQGLFTTKPINSVEDMAGLKLRIYNPVTARIAELARAHPFMIQPSEQVQALATGVVNANISSPTSGYDIKAWEQTKYFSNLQAWIPKNAVIVSQRAFDALGNKEREAVLAAAASAETRGWKLSEEKTRWSIEQLAAHGMVVSSPSPSFKAQLQKFGDIMIEEWVKEAGSDGRTLIRDFKN